jgi:hypothetical protein
MNPREIKQVPHNTDNKAVEDLQAWESLERVKPPWVAIVHGETILPPNDQKVAQPLTNEQVLQRRDEKVVGGSSSARPLNGRGQDHGASESSQSKQTRPQPRGNNV